MKHGDVQSKYRIGIVYADQEGGGGGGGEREKRQLFPPVNNEGNKRQVEYCTVT